MMRIPNIAHVISRFVLSAIITFAASGDSIAPSDVHASRARTADGAWALPTRAVDVSFSEPPVLLDENSSVLYIPSIVSPRPSPTSNMIFIPAGTFQMGCDSTNDPNCWPDQLPIHTVFLDAYYIDKYEVTNSRYKTCVDAGVCLTPSYKGSATRFGYYNTVEFADFSVIYVSWYQARDFCFWEGKRLPTEAEWEKSARGSDDTRIYPWGNQTPKCELVKSWIDCLRSAARNEISPDNQSETQGFRCALSP